MSRHEEILSRIPKLLRDGAARAYGTLTPTEEDREIMEAFRVEYATAAAALRKERGETV